MGQDAQPPAAATKEYNFFISAATSDWQLTEWSGKQLEESFYLCF